MDKDKDKEARRSELRALGATDAGREQLLVIWRRATGKSPGTMPEPWTPVIAEILAREFPPNDADPRGT